MLASPLTSGVSGTEEGIMRVDVLCLLLKKQGDWLDLVRRDCLRTMGDISVSNPSNVLRSFEDSSKTLSGSESELLMSPNFNVLGLYTVPDLV